MSGKTQSTCYVEFGTYSDAQRMVHRRNNRALGTRNVQLSIVPQEELMEAVFPRFRGEWRGVDPWIREVEEAQSAANAQAIAAVGSVDGIITIGGAGGGGAGGGNLGVGQITAGVESGEYMSRDGIVTGGFVSREEINSILTHAKTYRVCSPSLRQCTFFVV
jgi:hypothetical protein